MAVAAFWIALAAVLIAGSWRKKSIEQMRHETVRQLILRDGEIDADKLKELLDPPRPPPLPEGHPWLRKPELGHAYRVFRVFGSILMIGSVGFGAVAYAIAAAEAPTIAVVVGASVVLVTLLLGVGFFLASRFVPRPEVQKTREDQKTSKDW